MHHYMYREKERERERERERESIAENVKLSSSFRLLPCPIHANKTVVAVVAVVAVSNLRRRRKRGPKVKPALRVGIGVQGRCLRWQRMYIQTTVQYYILL